MAGMDDYLDGSSYTGDSSEGGGKHMSLKDQGEGFYGRVTGDQDKKFGDHDPNAKSNGAAAGLKGGEKSALGGNGSKITGDGTTGARQGENNVAAGTASENATSGFKNSVGGKTFGTGKGKAKGWKGKMKKMAPMLVAAGGIGGFGIASFFGQMAMPFSLIAQLQGNFNSIGTSQHVRTGKFQTWQMDSEKRKIVKNPIKARIFGKDKFKISKRQEAKLAKSGIRVDRSGDYTTLKFTGSNGQEMTIVPDSRQAGGDNTVAFKDYYEDNMEFRDSYAQGARTWRGAIGAWFDKLTTKFLSFFHVSRGVWSRFKKGQNTEEDFKNMRSKVSEGNKNNIEGQLQGDEHDYDKHEVDDIGEDGKPTGTTHEEITEPRPDVDDLDISADDIDVDSTGKIKAGDGGKSSKLADKLNKFANGVAGKVTGWATAAASFVCSALNALSAINLLVMAYQTTQIIKVASNLFESIQKGQVDDSNTTPINVVAESLVMRSTKTYNYTDENGNPKDETRTLGAMEANSVKALYGNHAADYKDLSIQSFTLENQIGPIISNVLGLASDAFYACTIAQAAAGFLDAAIDAVQLVICIFTFGIGCAVDAMLDAFVSIATGAAISMVIGAIVTFILPQIVNVLTRKIATDVFGEDLGNALVSGGNIYMGQNHQYGGGSPSSQDSLLKYLAVKNEVDEDEARIARETLSPFDYTSRYTFAGSLVAKIIPVMTTTSTAIGSLSSLGNMFSKSLSSIMPGASAVTAGITVQEAAKQTKDHCTSLDSIGAIGDVFCNPMIITDTTTLSDDPADVVTTIDEKYDGFTNDTGNDVPTIKKNSNLAKYIVYCGQRQSPFGVADNNIANDVQGLNVGSSMGDSIVGAVPIIGDLIGSLKNVNILKNYGWVSGQSCVVGNSKIDKKAISTAPTWEENKAYQRFIEDQRLAENMGLVEKSSVTAFLEEYYEEHPIDNSYEGILARRSGLTKQQVADTLDMMEFIAWLHDYDPIGYAPYIYDEPEEEKLFIEETEDYGSVIALIPNLFFEEHRVRNFAA